MAKPKRARRRAPRTFGVSSAPDPAPEKTYNAWISVSQAMKQELQQWAMDAYPADAPPQVGPPPDYIVTPGTAQFPQIFYLTPPTKRFFRGIIESNSYERYFKTWSAAGRTYSLWSIYSSRPDDLQMVKADLDMLAATYDKDFAVVGAWRYHDGNPVGGVDDPWYTQPPELIHFMPDVDGQPATELTDCMSGVNQAARVFIQ